MVYTSPLLSDARNKLGGTVFSRASGMATIRAKVAGLHSVSPSASGVTASVSAIASQWRGIGAAAQAQWRGVASGVQRRNALGVVYTLSGFSLYVMCVRNQRLVNWLLPPSLPDVHAPFVNATGFGIESNYSGADWLGVQTGPPVITSEAVPNVLLSFTPPLSPGVAYTARTQYRTLRPPYENFGGEYLIHDAYIAEFGQPQRGALIFCRRRWIYPLTGWSSGVEQAFCPVTG